MKHWFPYVTVLPALLLALLVATLAGCGGSGMLDSTAPTDNEITTDVILGPADATTGNLTFSVGDIVGTYNPQTGEVSAKSVTGRWVDWKSLRIRIYNAVTHALLGTIILTPANPTGSVQAIPGGTQVNADATLYYDVARTQVITTGVSDTKTIVPGGSVTLSLTLLATKPVLTVMAPANAGHVNVLPGDTVTVQVKAVDLGAGKPTVLLTDNGVPVTATATVTGNSSATGRIFTWHLVQGTGDHTMVAKFTSTSHLSIANSGERTTSPWTYNVNTGGDVEVGVQSL